MRCLLRKELMFAFLGTFRDYLRERFNIVVDASDEHADERINAAAAAWVSVSDYTNTVPYEKRLAEFVALLKTHGIRVTTAAMKVWRDFGFPDHPFHFTRKNVAAHRIACSPIFHGYNDGKIFYCHVAWSVANIGRSALHPGDFIDLRTLAPKDRHIIATHCLGETIKDGAASLCYLCGGCGLDNPQTVVAGKQMGTEAV